MLVYGQTKPINKAQYKTLPYTAVQHRTVECCLLSHAVLLPIATIIYDCHHGADYRKLSESVTSSCTVCHLGSAFTFQVTSRRFKIYEHKTEAFFQHRACRDGRSHAVVEKNSAQLRSRRTPESHHDMGCSSTHHALSTWVLRAAGHKSSNASLLICRSSMDHLLWQSPISVFTQIAGRKIVERILWTPIWAKSGEKKSGCHGFRTYSPDYSQKSGES